MNIFDALADAQLFGALPAFRDLEPWRPWLAFLRAVYGLPMGEADVDLFRKRTGRSEPRVGGYPEAVAVVGVQSGKSQVAALIGVFEAARGVMAGARGLYVPLVAQDLRGAQRALFAYATEAVRASPVLAREVTRETADALELGGVTLGVYPCRPAALRGIRAACVCVDELAFFTATDGRPTDTEMLRVARGRVATTGGKVLVLSSPYGQSGALWDLHRRHFGRDESATLVWQASAPEMNPTLPADYLARMEQDDPEAFRSEVLGEFRAGIASLLDPDSLDALVPEGVRERAPSPGVRHLAFVDPSGGRSDAFALAIAHESEGLIVLDLARAWRPPFSPAGVVEECAQLLEAYGVREVTGDRYAGEWPREQFRALGIGYNLSEKPKSDIYLDLLATVNSAQLVMLDVPELLRELRGLERRRGTSGRDKVDHRPGAHDDLANAVAGVASLVAAERSRVPAAWVICAGGIEREFTRDAFGNVVGRVPWRRRVLGR